MQANHWGHGNQYTKDETSRRPQTQHQWATGCIPHDRTNSLLHVYLTALQQKDIITNYYFDDNCHGPNIESCNRCGTLNSHMSSTGVPVHNHNDHNACPAAILHNRSIHSATVYNKTRNIPCLSNKNLPIPSDANCDTTINPQTRTPLSPTSSRSTPAPTNTQQPASPPPNTTQVVLKILKRDQQQKAKPPTTSTNKIWNMLDIIRHRHVDPTAPSTTRLASRKCFEVQWEDNTLTWEPLDSFISEDAKKCVRNYINTLTGDADFQHKFKFFVQPLQPKSNVLPSTSKSTKKRRAANTPTEDTSTHRASPRNKNNKQSGPNSNNPNTTPNNAPPKNDNSILDNVLRDSKKPSLQDIALATSLNSIKSYARTNNITIQQQVMDGSCGPRSAQWLLNHTGTGTTDSPTEIKKKVYDHIIANYTERIHPEDDLTWNTALGLPIEQLHTEKTNLTSSVPELFFTAFSQVYAIPIIVVHNLHNPSPNPKLHFNTGVNNKDDRKTKNILYIFIQYSTRKQSDNSLIPYPAHFLGGYKTSQ